MEAKAIWKGKMSFDGWADSGFTLPMGTKPESGGDDDGFRPVELLLVGLAGCTAMDVISILQKKRQEVTGFEVNVQGERAEDHPRRFVRIVVEYVVTGRGIDPEAVERAVELSETKYCSVSGSLSKEINVEHRVVVKEAEQV